MRRLGLNIGILFLTFVCGVTASRIVQYLRNDVVFVRGCYRTSGKMPRFVAVSSMLDRDYHIYRYRSPTSDNPEEITLYGDFRSAQVTREHFESNATTPAARLIESGPKFDVNGRQIGLRGVSVFKTGGAVRIFWTDGDTFWSLQAPTLALAREFEESHIVRSITRSNNRLERTRL